MSPSGYRKPKVNNTFHSFRLAAGNTALLQKNRGCASESNAVINVILSSAAYADLEKRKDDAAR